MPDDILPLAGNAPLPAPSKRATVSSIGSFGEPTDAEVCHIIRKHRLGAQAMDDTAIKNQFGETFDCVKDALTRHTGDGT